MHIDTHIHVHVHIHAHRHACIHVHARTYTQTFTYRYTYTCRCTCTHVYIRALCVCVHITLVKGHKRMYIYLRTSILLTCAYTWRDMCFFCNLYVQSYRHAKICVRCAYIHVCIYVCACADSCFLIFFSCSAISIDQPMCRYGNFHVGAGPLRIGETSRVAIARLHGLRRGGLLYCKRSRIWVLELQEGIWI